jgi:hypothetical protein
MIRERKFIVCESGEVKTRLEEVSCKPSHFDENDIVYASFILSIAKFISEYEQRLQDPSFYTDIEDVEIKSTSIDTSYNIFPKQPEPLLVKNKSWLEYNTNYKPAISKGIFDTKYFRLIEVKID